MRIAPLTSTPLTLTPTINVPMFAPIPAPARVAAPMVDFPGITSGMSFNIVDGSKAGPISVRGEASITRLDDDHAAFHVAAGRFGMKVDVNVEVERTGADTVRLRSHGSGLPDTVADGRIVMQRTNYVEFARLDAPDERTIIAHDGAGHITIDTVVPAAGRVHLVLERR